MKRITIVTMQLKTPGGIERFITTLANLLCDNYEVTLVANYGRANDPLAFPLDSRVKLHFLTPIQPAEISMKNLLLHPTKWPTIPTELRRRRNIVSTQHQVFHKFFHNLYTDYIITDRATYSNLIADHYPGSAIKIATDHNFHQYDPRYINELLESIKSFDYLVVATDELRNYYSSRTKAKCITIPNPLPSLPKNKSSLTSKNLISVGRLVPEKDYPLLISAMSLIHEKAPDIHLTIVGDGLDHPRLKHQISTLHLEDAVTLTGWLPQPDIAKLYLDSSLYVSTSRTEAFGLTLTEAMSYGLPCLALSRASGARAQITSDTGALLDTPTPEAIATTILRLFSEPTLLKNYQSHLKDHLTKYSPATVKASWLSILRPEF